MHPLRQLLMVTIVFQLGERASVIAAVKFLVVKGQEFTEFLRWR